MMSDCEDGYRVSLVLNWVQVNGTGQFVYYKKYTKCPLDPLPIVAGVFLTLILIVSVTLSLLVVVTIATSYSLKKFLYTYIILNICIVVLVDCFVNLPIAIAYVTTAPWQFGYNICYFSSYMMLMVTIEMILSLSLFAFDRFFVLRKVARYLSLSKGKLKMIILLSWIVSIGCAIPLVCGFTSMPYRGRYSCTVADPNDDIYMIVLICLVIVPTAALMIIISMIAIAIFNKERKKQKKSKGQTFSLLEQMLMTPYYRNEVYSSICMVVLVLAYLVLWLPFGSLITIYPVTTTDWDNKTFDASHEFQDHYINMRHMDDHHDEFDLDHHNVTEIEDANSTINHVHNIPEIAETVVVDTVLVWFRFVFDMLVPIIILTVLKDIRDKCKSLMFCFQTSSMDSLSPSHGSSGLSKTPKSSGFSDIRPTRKKPKKEDKGIVNFKTPVLFATADGLHIRTVEDTFEEMNNQKNMFAAFGKNSNNDPKFAYEMCDVFHSASDLTDTDDLIIPTIDAVDDHPFVNSLRDSDPGPGTFQVLPKPIKSTNAKENLPNDKFENPVDKYAPPEDNVFDESIELGKPKKQKKNVRFDTNLNIMISRPTTPESARSEDSYSSVNSSDSGIDNEEFNHIPQPRRRFPPGRDIIPKPKSKKVIHNRKSVTFNSSPKEGKRKVSRNKISPITGGAPKVQKVKSRYMSHYKKSPVPSPSPNAFFL